MNGETEYVQFYAPNISTTSNSLDALPFFPLHVTSDIFPTKALCFTASALVSFIHPPIKYLLSATMCQALCWALETQMNNVWSLPPGQSPGVLGASLVIPSQPWATGSRCPSQQVRAVAGDWQTARPKVFPR